MRTLRAWVLRLKGVFRREQEERDFEAQLQADLDLQIEEGIRAGQSPGEARRLALAHVGGMDAAKEAMRDRRGVPLLETLVRDISHALRVLWRNKGWSAVAIASLALGIGANAATFSAADALLLRKLPLVNADDLVGLRWEGENRALTNFQDYGYVPGGPMDVFAAGGEFSFDKMRAGATGAYATFEQLSAANTTLRHLFALGKGPTVHGTADRSR
jgi:hypothetical protein